MRTSYNFSSTLSLDRRKNLTSRLLRPEIQKFVSNTTHQPQSKYTTAIAQVNPAGFIQVIMGGMKCTGDETVEIDVNQIDLSIHQNKGFSIFFWLYLPQLSNSITSTILVKGDTVDNTTPKFSISRTRTSSFLEVQVTTSKFKTEKIFANKILEKGHLYSLAVTFSINYKEDYTEVSIYLDGKLNTQTTFPGEPIHNQGNVYIGNPPGNVNNKKGFKGTIADVIIIPSVIYESQIKYVHDNGLESLMYSKGTALQTETAFKSCFGKDRLTRKYAHYAKKSLQDIYNLSLTNTKYKSIVIGYDKNERNIDMELPVEQVDINEERMIENLRYFMSSEDNEIRVLKIMEKAKFINTIMYLALEGNDIIPINRLVKIFDVISEVMLIDIDENFLKELSFILYARRGGNNSKLERLKKYDIHRTIFFTNLERGLQRIEDEQKRKEEEAAKYQTLSKRYKKGKKLKLKTPSVNNVTGIKELYLRKNRLLPKDSDYQYTEVKAFESCLPQHENLLLSLQNLRNTVDLDREKELHNYQTNFVIKTLYEKPKNLPGDNPSCLEAETLDKSELNDFKNTDEQTNEDVPVLSHEEQQMLDQLVLEILINEGWTPSEGEQLSQAEQDIYINNALPNKTFDLYDSTAVASAQIASDNYTKQQEHKQYIINSKQKRIDEEKALQTQLQQKTETNAVKQTHTFDPEIPTGWSDGNLEIVINHCYYCAQHETTGKHMEATYLEKFNEIGDAIKKIFPNSIIIGNLDERAYLGNFDVYLRGTGLPGDALGRYFIFRKRDTNAFPTAWAIIDKLIALSIMYGTSMNIERAQVDDINDIRRPETHEHPVDIPDGLIKYKDNWKEYKKVREENYKLKGNKDTGTTRLIGVDPSRTKLICPNWGCGQEFLLKDNSDRKPCLCHPGKWQFGSYNKYWPACWTCCEGKWDSEGCTRMKHKEVHPEAKTLLCVNYGEINPNTGRPDSACGLYFSEKEDDGCVYHSGYIEHGVFTCCGGAPGSEGCINGKHIKADYPDEKAQLYFHRVSLENPGIPTLNKDKQLSYKKICELNIINSDYFKNAKTYPDYKGNYEERKRREDEEPQRTRYCMNWGCSQGEFLVKDNHVKACHCHPGKWDHGATAPNMRKHKEVLSDPDNLKPGGAVKWVPHWTCCGGKWEDPPCSYTKHYGPYVENVTNEDKKIKYPDERVKLKFKKEVACKSSTFIQQFMYEKPRVKALVNAKKSEYTSSSDLPALCDMLKLNYLILQEDPSYHLKYNDIIDVDRTVKWFMEGDNINHNKFIEWWFMPWIELYNKLYPEQQQQEEENKK